jgi:flavin-dependent dehydrogenase
VTPSAADVCVIGGGPAGSTAAIRLATLGYRVDLLERCAAPRPHPAESLSDGILGVLDALGIRDELASATGLRAAPAHVEWDADHPDIRRAPRWLLADRVVFSGRLLDVARDRGVRITRPATALAVTRRDEWHVRVAAGGAVSERRARFLVDATGRSGLSPERRQPTSPPTLALHGELSGVSLAGPCVEALPDGWLWTAPVRPGRASTVVFTDADTLRDVGRSGLESRFRALLARSRRLAGAGGAPLTAGVRAFDATCYASVRVTGEGFVRVGEAAAALDPLSSSGIERAMRSALVAAALVHTTLVRPDDAALARRFFADREREAAERHAAWAGSSYASVARFHDRSFWRTRARPSLDPSPVVAAPPIREFDEVMLSPEARVMEEACLVGDVIEPRLAVHHPALARPVAFVDGVEIARLLQVLEGRIGLSTLVERWQAMVDPNRARRVADWLLRHGILTPPDQRSPISR